ncbi:MAG TPA: 3-deoxy-manno-octulosonate cytidylyltransferase [Chitinophagaceae bacterium]|nr:3-deoxy-manno-octulosonate cytidylyltransferase [Chitinophagaceae bacterium]
MYKVIALIPARYAATRFPGKLMKVLEGKTIIRRTYEAVNNTQLFKDVIVVCDHEIIFNEIISFGGKAIMSRNQHESGTDRIAEVAQDLDADIFVNVQGDEPFISALSLQKLISLFSNQDVEVGSLILPIHDIQKIENPNCVKVVVDKQKRAMYFSRSPIPYYRETSLAPAAYQHIGVYAFKKPTLLKITQLPVSELEFIEKLENLRMLENGISIYMAEIDQVGISIDTEEDFENAKQYLSKLNNQD